MEIIIEKNVRTSLKTSLSVLTIFFFFLLLDETPALKKYGVRI